MNRQQDAPVSPGSGQTALWNGAAGQAWADLQEVLDQAFRPFEQRLVESAAAAGSRRVLDIGCGAGGTTLALSRALGPDARCTGVDISEPLLATARARAERDDSTAVFLAGDAQTFPFPPAVFDRIVSRFGVMFFESFPGAFGNLRRAAVPGAFAHFLTWRAPADNPFMTVAERAAAPLLPGLPPRRPGPGQFGLADPDRAAEFLGAAGWTEISIRPLDAECSFPADALVPYFTRLGPLSQILPDLQPDPAARVVAAIRKAFDPYVFGNEVRFNAACWEILARNGGVDQLLRNEADGASHFPK